jgi:hypothetical protein
MVIYPNMKLFRVVLPVLFSVLAAFVEVTNAQEIHYYERLTDPRAITRLDNVDNEPVRISAAVGWPKGARDPIDGFHVLAQDTGAGIITHLWTQLHEQQDSLTFIRIRIDDSLVAEGHLYSFFKQKNGAFRAPLDSLCSGAQVCDIQMPYKRNFRVTYYADWNVCCLFWAVEYRRIQDSNRIESFRNPPSASYMQQLKVAEERIHQTGTIWDNTNTKTINISETLPARDTLVLAEINGSALIQTLRILPSVIDSAILRKITLAMYWDGSPYPSVEVPLPDFFGAGAGLRNITSFYQYVTKGGEFTSYFPMPFQFKGKVVLINNSEFSLSILAEVKYSKEPVDREKVGYFTTLYNESTPTKFGVLHPAGTLLGRGKYIGIHMSFPGYNGIYFLEGDPIFAIDSNIDNAIRYTGMEDYFNGGYFFEDGGFSLPFVGCPDRWYSTYRFHVLAPYDFHKSFDLKLEHGFRNDFQVNFRTVSFFYKQWTPFWVARDSIRVGEKFVVGGSGYSPNEVITAKVGSNTLFTMNADSKGEFSTTVDIPSLANAQHMMTINGVIRPEPITVLKNPVLTIIRDSIPYVYRYTERIHVRGGGFPLGSTISLHIDTALIATGIKPDSNYRFDLWVNIPWIPEGKYKVSARINGGGLITADSSFQVSRTLRYEFEDLYPPYYQTNHAWPGYLGYIGDTTFSQRNTGYFGANSDGQGLGFRFTVPVSDTFDVSYFHGKGRRYGNFDVLIDSVLSAKFVGYYDTNYYYETVRSPKILGNRIYLAKGKHTIEFVCTGTHPTSTEYLLDIDNMILTPSTAYRPFPPDTTLDTPIVTDGQKGIVVQTYPNPVTNGTLMLKFSSGDGAPMNATVVMRICDVLGSERQVETFYIPDRNMETRGITVSGLVPGTYFCIITINNAGKEETTVSSIIIDR